MPRFSITLPSGLNEWVEDEVDAGDPTAPDSKSEAARLHLANARRLAEIDATLDELIESHRHLEDLDDDLADLVAARDRVEELETEIEEVRAERVGLRAR